MRIVLFTASYPPRIGGVETVTHRLAQELLSRGHEVEVVTHRYPRRLPARERIDGLEVRRRIYPNLLPGPVPRSRGAVLKSLAALPIAALEVLYLCIHLLRKRPHVISAHYFSAPVAYCILAAKFVRVPLVLSFHGSDAATVPYPASYRWTVRVAMEAADSVIACSHNLASYLRAGTPRRLHPKLSVAHYGVDASVLGSGDTDSDVVLLPSRLVAKKGIDVAIQAIAELRDRGLPVPLWVAGDGPLRGRLTHLVSQLDLGGQVRFLGPVPHFGLPELINRARFVLVPSYWEAFGMIVLEAMAAGKAVVATTNGGPSEIVMDGESGLLVPAGDPIALAGAIEALWTEPRRAAAMGRMGLDRALSDFTWPQMAEAYESTFCEAIAARRERLPDGGRRESLGLPS
ncbi:MAG TPA: glycosyltransferase family 4 protein [Chloroflexota bacterium]|nr:glycosyltransferase family 4 protein [Chloroflexota bacterium]